MQKVRIQKLLSELGVCSRRKAEQLLLDGKISVNNQIVTELGFSCTLDDEIKVNGVIVNKKDEIKEKIYIAINKPMNIVSTSSDPQGRKTVVSMIDKKYGRLFTVGRLDYNSTGLLLLTNDGGFANLISHPSTAPEKEYLVKVENPLHGDEIEKLETGIYIFSEGYTTKPCKAKVLKSNDDSVIFSLILHEGKKREIRRMMDVLNHPVISLMRIRIGTILLGNLKEGEYRMLNKEEVENLITLCNKK